MGRGRDVAGLMGCAAVRPACQASVCQDYGLVWWRLVVGPARLPDLPSRRRCRPTRRLQGLADIDGERGEVEAQVQECAEAAARDLGLQLDKTLK